MNECMGHHVLVLLQRNLHHPIKETEIAVVVATGNVGGLPQKWKRVARVSFLGLPVLRRAQWEAKRLD